jgi:hypothetical protein
MQAEHQTENGKQAITVQRQVVKDTHQAAVVHLQVPKAVRAAGEAAAAQV